eukprot:2682817-Rhodomonas_salina.1
MSAVKFRPFRARTRVPPGVFRRLERGVRSVQEGFCTCTRFQGTGRFYGPNGSRVPGGMQNRLDPGPRILLPMSPIG